MNVKVKGVNDYLYFELDSHIPYSLIMEDLKSILDTLPASVQDYYPKAFFDFRGRKLSENQFNTLLMLIESTRKVLFGGLQLELSEKKMKLIEKDIYNGEVLELNEDILIIGDVHYGAVIKNTHDIYIVGEVSGSVEGLSKSCMINISRCNKADIRIFNQTIQNVTISSLALFYYKDDKIKITNQ
ncbi:MAG: hypothetical protein ACLSXC_05060 [Beduini sp.]